MNLGTKIDRQQPLKLQQHPGRQFAYAGRLGDKQFNAVARIYIVDRRVIHLTMMGQGEEIDQHIADKFFGSLKLAEDQSDED